MPKTGPEPEKRACPWCGNPMPPPKAKGRPRQTCGADRCRRLNGTANAVKARHQAELAALRAERDDAVEDLWYAMKGHARDADRLAFLADELVAVTERALRDAPARSRNHRELAQFLADVLRSAVPGRAEELADIARRMKDSEERILRARQAKAERLREAQG